MSLFSWTYGEKYKEIHRSNNTRRNTASCISDLWDADALNYSCSAKDKSKGWQHFPPVYLRQFLRKILNCVSDTAIAWQKAVFQMTHPKDAHVHNNVRYTKRWPGCDWHHFFFKPPDRYTYNIKESVRKASREHLTIMHSVQLSCACRTTTSHYISNAETQMLHFIAFKRLKIFKQEPGMQRLDVNVNPERQ